MGILFLVFPLSCTTDYYFEEPLVDESSDTSENDDPDESASDPSNPGEDPTQGSGSPDNPDTANPYAGRVTYEVDVKPILNQLCVACHNPSLHEDGVDLSTYALAKSNINDILESMQEDDSDDIMPPSGRVDNAVIQTLYTWVSDGLLEGEAPPEDPDTGSTDGMYTYTADIINIIDRECIFCHGASSPAGGYDISTYQKVVDQIGVFLDRIDLQTGQVGIMPPAGRMDETTIQTIKDWIDQGMPQ